MNPPALGVAQYGAVQRNAMSTEVKPNRFLAIALADREKQNALQIYAPGRPILFRFSAKIQSERELIAYPDDAEAGHQGII